MSTYLLQLLEILNNIPENISNSLIELRKYDEVN